MSIIKTGKWLENVQFRKINSNLKHWANKEERLLSASLCITVASVADNNEKTKLSQLLWISFLQLFMKLCTFFSCDVF